MFVFHLRGEFGILTTLRLHVLFAVTVFLMVFSSQPVDQLVAIGGFISGTTSILEHMNQNKRKLQFSSPSARVHTYPTTPEIVRVQGFAQWVMIIVFLVPSVIAYVGSSAIGMELTSEDRLAIWSCFYAGCLTLVGVIHKFIHTRNAE